MLEDLGQLLWIVVLGAIIDSIDPCMYALYISLLLSASVIGIQRVMKTATTFIISVYAGYLIFNAILRFILKLASPPKSILSLVLILYASVMILYTLLLERRSDNSVCREDKLLCRFMGRLNLNSGTFNIFNIATIGFVASFTVLPCSAGMAVAFNSVTSTLGLWMWIPLAMLYTAVFVSPLILISFAFVGLTKIKKVYEVSLKHQALVKVLGGVLMIFVAVLVMLDLLVP